MPLVMPCGSSRAVLQGEGGRGVERPLCGTLCPTRGPWPGVAAKPALAQVPHGGDGEHGFLPHLRVQAIAGLLLQQRLQGTARWMAQGSISWPASGSRGWPTAYRMAAPSQTAPGAQHPARGCSPRGRASPHLDALRHLQLAEIHRVPRAGVRDGGLAGVADGGQKPQLLRLSLSCGGERRASGSGEPSRGCPQEASSRGTKASGTLGLRLQQARRKLRASSSS